MARSAASITAEIAAIDAVITTNALSTTSADGVSASINLDALYARRYRLERDLEIANGTFNRFARGRVDGL